MNEVSKKQYLYFCILAVVGISVLYLFPRGSMAPTYRNCSGVVWTTQYHITYESETALDDSILTVFNLVDNSLSMFNDYSLISRINKGEHIPADSMLICLYETSVKVNSETDGAFDPTVSPLMKAWGFVEKTGELPERAEIDSIMEFVGIGKTSLKDGYIVKTDSRTAFDFSAIAKGFACDEIGRMLRRNGVENYLVEVGGEIALRGRNDSGQRWCVSVDSPIESSDSVIHENACIIRLGKGGIATSGNYRNFNDIEGRKVVHTMNPKTGFPETSSLLSATIIAKNCMLADAYATACMVMGLEKSKTFLQENEGIAGFLIYTGTDETLSTWHNTAFEKIKAK